MKASKADIPFRVDFSIDDDNIDVVKSAQTTAAEWTRYEIKVDLSDKTSEDLSTLRIRIRPNCTSSGSVKTKPLLTISMTSASHRPPLKKKSPMKESKKSSSPMEISKSEILIQVLLWEQIRGDLI